MGTPKMTLNGQLGRKYMRILWKKKMMYMSSLGLIVANPIEVFYSTIDDKTIRVFHAMALRDKTAAQMN